MREQMNIVVIGHVDHGKSTVIGRLLADTDSLPKGKLEEVKRRCAQNARPFEYAFLLDALKDEQTQGITIDSARCFFHSARREYIIIDAPGHIEFLKNMVSGAARAEAALLVIDAKEGIRENSRRHGYLLGMLGIRQVTVLVNKMDLIDHSQNGFDAIRGEYTTFLENIGIRPRGFIPISARNGDNIVRHSENLPWYQGPSVLDMMDGFEKAAEPADKPVRFPVQDIYKFTEDGDERRIFAGRLETGTISVGDEVVFLPSRKLSRITTIEGFNRPTQEKAVAGQSTGFTLDTQVYVQPGELMCRVGQEPAMTASQFRANLFWMGRAPMIRGKRYKLKLAGVRVPVWLKDIHTVMDAADLVTDSTRQQIEWHDVAQCTLETLKPIAFDNADAIAQTGRFVIIDNYEIAGGGIVLEKVESSSNRIDEHVRQRERNWQRTAINAGLRAGRYHQKAALILIAGPVDTGKVKLAQALEESLFAGGRLVYYLGISNSLTAVGHDVPSYGERDEYLRRLGEVAHLFTDAGVILIATASDLEDFEVQMVETLNQPNDCIVINIGENRLGPGQADLEMAEVTQENQAAAIQKIKQLLEEKQYLVEYYV